MVEAQEDSMACCHLLEMLEGRECVLLEGWDTS